MNKGTKTYFAFGFYEQHNDKLKCKMLSDMKFNSQITEGSNCIVSITQPLIHKARNKGIVKYLFRAFSNVKESKGDVNISILEDVNDKLFGVNKSVIDNMSCCFILNYCERSEAIFQL